MTILEVGKKVSVRNQYTVVIGGDLFQGGEILEVTAKNLPELTLQENQLELPREVKTESKMIKEEFITNRAITEPKETRSSRTKLKKDEVQEVK